jgi:hypothetical protein
MVLKESNRKLNTFYNITDDDALKLIEKYMRTPWIQFQNGEVSTGQVLKAIMDRDELLTNEKCFLTAHMTSLVEKSFIKDLILQEDFGKLARKLGIPEP